MTALGRPSPDVWRRHDGAVWRYTGDGIVLLAVLDAELTVLDEAGAVVWQELRTPTTVETLCQRVADRVGASPSSVTDGVEQVLAHLAHRGLAGRDDA